MKFTNFVNLQRLYVSGNPFYGSLKPLKNLNNLREIGIADTDVDSGLEYLPDSLKSFACSSNLRKDAKVKTIIQELKKYGEPSCFEFINIFQIILMSDVQINF